MFSLWAEIIVRSVSQTLGRHINFIVLLLNITYDRVITAHTLEWQLKYMRLTLKRSDVVPFYHIGEINAGRDVLIVTHSGSYLNVSTSAIKKKKNAISEQHWQTSGNGSNLLLKLWDSHVPLSSSLKLNGQTSHFKCSVLNLHLYFRAPERKFCIRSPVLRWGYPLHLHCRCSFIIKPLLNFRNIKQLRQKGSNILYVAYTIHLSVDLSMIMITTFNERDPSLRSL